MDNDNKSPNTSINSILKSPERSFNNFSNLVNNASKDNSILSNLKYASPISYISKSKNKSKKINSFLFDRTKFILKILNYASDKLMIKKENLLAKGLKWLTKEVEDSILFKSDKNAVKNLEELKNENKDLHTIFSWLEEYSTIKIKRNENFENLKKNLILKIEDIPVPSVKNLFEKFINNFNSGSNSNEISNNNNNNSNNEISSNNNNNNLLNFSEINFKLIENENFNIFKFEEAVKQENTLSTISCYIFSSLGYYSYVSYEKFENFISKIAIGYDRRNPYHNVIRNHFYLF